MIPRIAGMESPEIQFSARATSILGPHLASQNKPPHPCGKRDHSVLGGNSLHHRLQPLGQARPGGECPFFARASLPPVVGTFK